MKTTKSKSLAVLSLMLAAALAVVSFFGAFVPSTYERDAPSMAVQGMGQDLVDLFLVVPLLVISLVFVLRKSRVAHLIYGGTVLYILYSFVIYSFGVNFNKLFLFYCLILGLSFYSLILILCKLNSQDVEHWFGVRIPSRLVGTYLIVVAAMFYALWLKDVLPAVVTGSIPKSVSDYDLLVNPVHVLDIGLVLPGLILTAVLLMKKHRLGYILAPIFLVFIIVLAAALTGMVILLKAKGLSDDSSVAGIFIALALISGVFLFVFFKHLKARSDTI
jgi:hypothetical protein